MTQTAHSPAWEFRSALHGAVWPAIPHRAGAAVLSLLFQFERSQWLPADALQALQLRQLGALLRHAWETVPYYRERWGAAPDATGFAQLPLLTRRDLQDHVGSLKSERVPAEHGAITESNTSGSTGAPVRVKKTQLSSLLWNAFTLRDHLWHGRDLRGKLAVIRTKIMVSQMKSWGAATAGLVDTGPAVLLGIETNVATQLEWLQREQPDYLLTYATLAGELARASLERGIRLPSLREVRTFAECLSTETRQACRRAWGQKVTDIYSTVEVGYIALQCPLHEHYHVQSEGVLLEILDDEGRPCAPGQIGRVVVTDLHNFATPLIRYAIGDLAEPGEACSCGRGLPVLRRILGRERNALVTRSGERYWPYFGGAEGIMDAAPVRQVQFVQKDYDLVVARLVTPGPLSPEQEDGLRKRVLAFLPPGLRLEFQYCDSIPRGAGGKFEEFVSQVAMPGAA